ncbi:MAG TPA: hypothetical protein VMA13_09555 [Candidatus Saccharimonadales bacterium]|nr:hypothetical protein [Candidatus Saccharimonadales bacterium]
MEKVSGAGDFFKPHFVKMLADFVHDERLLERPRQTKYLDLPPENIK